MVLYKKPPYDSIYEVLRYCELILVFRSSPRTHFLHSSAELLLHTKPRAEHHWVGGPYPQGRDHRSSISHCFITQHLHLCWIP